MFDIDNINVQISFDKDKFNEAVESVKEKYIDKPMYDEVVEKIMEELRKVALGCFSVEI